jgi:hypothetical protein
MIREQAMRPVNWLKEKWSALTTLIADIDMPDLSWSGIKDMFKGVINKLIGGLNWAICKAVGLYNSTIGQIGIGDFSFSITAPQIPPWHTGGIVPGGPGANVPAMLQGGERVIPRNSVNYAGGGGGSSQVFNISINSQYSPGDILKSIVQSGATDEVAYLNTVG